MTVLAKEKKSIHIRPPQKKVTLNLGELIPYWDLIFILIWREIKIR